MKGGLKLGKSHSRVQSVIQVLHNFLFIQSNIFITIPIVFVWSQYDGANIEQRTIGYGWRQNKEVKLKIV